MIPQFLETAVTGILPTGKQLKAMVLDPQKLLNGWNKIYDVSLPRIGDVVKDVKGWIAPVTPNDRIFEIIGSYAYRTGMTLLPGDMNLLKRNIMAGHNLKDITKMNKAINEAMGGNVNGAKVALGVLQKGIGVSIISITRAFEVTWTWLGKTFRLRLPEQTSICRNSKGF
jgi:chitinase